MRKRILRGIAQLGIAAGIFTAGFLCGSFGEHPAGAQMDAQMKELGGAVMKEAGGQGGALGAAGELGTSILEMQDHVTALQKNLDTLKKIKSALGG
jgi:hypothetical protein